MLVRSRPARAVRRSTKRPTTGLRVLLESSVARVLLNVVAAAAAAAAMLLSALLGHKTREHAVSTTSPTRRPVIRPSLPTHTIHVARHHVLQYALTTLWPCTKVVVDGKKLCSGAGLEVGANTSALGPSLTNNTYHQYRSTQ